MIMRVKNKLIYSLINHGIGGFSTNSTKVIAIVVIAALVVGGVAAIIISNNNGGKTSSSDPMDMTWDQIVSDAKGQTVTMGFYVADPMVAVWYPEFQEEMKNKYDITIVAQSYGPAAAAIAVKEMEAGQMTNGTFDFIWGDTSAYGAMKNSKGDFSFVYDDTRDGKSWASKLPNSYYLKSTSEEMISGMYSQYVPGSAMNFSNGQTMLVYNKDFNIDALKINDNLTIRIPYNVVVFFDSTTNQATGFAKVGTDGTAFDNDSEIVDINDVTSQTAFDTLIQAATTYDIDTVRSTISSTYDAVKGHLKYALPWDCATLLEWAKIYEGQFGYPAPTNGSAVFHTNLLSQAMVYELTWGDKNSKTGWSVAVDKEANVKEVNANLANVNSKETYNQYFGYVFNYLKELDAYVHQWSTTSKYQDTGTIVAYNNLIVGNNKTDKDFGDGTIMIAMSTVTSIDSRVGEGKQYDYNAGAFSLDTGCSSDYYCFIPENSSHKTAAMVVLNALLDPQEQVKWFSVTGNGFNIDTTKNVIGGSETVYDKYFKSVLENMSIYLSPQRLDEVTEVARLTGSITYFTANWSELINS